MDLRHDKLTPLVSVWRLAGCSRANTSRRPWTCGCPRRIVSAEPGRIGFSPAPGPVTDSLFGSRINRLLKRLRELTVYADQASGQWMTWSKRLSAHNYLFCCPTGRGIQSRHGDRYWSKLAQLCRDADRDSLNCPDSSGNGRLRQVNDRP